MARYGMTIPLAGIPLHEHQDWFKEMVDLGYTDFWSSEANAHDGFTPLALAAAWGMTGLCPKACVPNGSQAFPCNLFVGSQQPMASPPTVRPTRMPMKTRSPCLSCDSGACRGLAGQQ